MPEWNWIAYIFRAFLNIFTILPFSSDSKQRIENFAEILSGEIILGLRSPLADDFTEAQKYYWSSCPIKKALAPPLFQTIWGWVNNMILESTISLKYKHISIFISVALFLKMLSVGLSQDDICLHYWVKAPCTSVCARSLRTGQTSSQHDTYHPVCDWCSASRPQCHARHIRLWGKQEVWERVTVLNPLSQGEGHWRCIW